ncbi:MAG: sigma-E factor negative regulatory protein [Psychromonas sp.]
MKNMNEQLSAMVDNELIDEQLISELISNTDKQDQFYRYHLIGDVIRDDIADQVLNIDISQQVMSEIKRQGISDSVVAFNASVNKKPPQTETNIVSFVKRFGQYAIAASVAGVVVLTSLMTSEPTFNEDSAGLEVLKTVPFGAATPVSLQANKKQSELEIKEHNERLEALLNDHQLQLQTQPLR